MIGYMYILECSDGTYYTGSTKNLEKRVWEHENIMGANYTKKKHPVKLVYYEKYSRIDKAFYREKQIQGWSHAKKKALIERNTNKLHELAECKNDTHFKTTAPSASLSDRTGGNRCPSGAEDEGVWSSIMGKK
ncbi:MAG: GIY-YIG nuclease family protein [Spirochaetales bacterium]|nr:GIY-YIG nuclease family protein [Spirochaetales bacterium]